MYKILKRGYYYNNAHKSEDEFLSESYPTEDMAYMAAELNAFAVDEDPDDFDFVVRCWDGDDYQIESRYKVIKEEEE